MMIKIKENRVYDFNNDLCGIKKSNNTLEFNSLVGVNNFINNPYALMSDYKCSTFFAEKNYESNIFISKNISLSEHQKHIFYIERFQKKIFTSVYVVFWMESLFDSYDFYEVNSILLNVDINYLEEWSIIAFLRSTYFAKDYLPAWSIFYQKSKKYLEYLGKEDIDGILIGLDR